jgi:hypothetical protein
MNSSIKRIHVYFTSETYLFTNIFPGWLPIVKGFHFTFGPVIPTPVDYVVILGTTNRSFDLPIARDRTIFVTSEPPSVQYFPEAYLKQFGTVFYCQEDYTGANRVDLPPLLPWFVGVDMGQEAIDRRPKGFDYFDALEFNEEDKQDRVSIIASATTITETHRIRFNFAQVLKKRLGDKADLFGRGFAGFGDKLDVLKPYKYHVALENFTVPNYWTEKMLDPMLSGCHPFYYGCPNVSDYFPQEAFTRIDIHQPEKAADLIEEAIASNLWRKSQAARLEGKKLALRKYNFPFFIVDYLAKKPASATDGRTKILPISAVKNSVRRIRNSVRDWTSVQRGQKPHKQVECRDDAFLADFATGKINSWHHIGTRDGSLIMHLLEQKPHSSHFIYEPRAGFHDPLTALFGNKPAVSLQLEVQEASDASAVKVDAVHIDCSLSHASELTNKGSLDSVSTVVLSNLWDKKSASSIREIRNNLARSHKKLKTNAYSYEIYKNTSLA